MSPARSSWMTLWRWLALMIPVVAALLWLTGQLASNTVPQFAIPQPQSQLVADYGPWGSNNLPLAPVKPEIIQEAVRDNAALIAVNPTSPSVVATAQPSATPTQRVATLTAPAPTVTRLVALSTSTAPFTAVPSATASPTALPTVTASATPSASATRRPPTLTPTFTPTPTATLLPSDTPLPPSDTPVPPTDTPPPTATPSDTPTRTPYPPRTPPASATPTITPTCDVSSGLPCRDITPTP